MLCVFAVAPVLPLQAAPEAEKSLYERLGGVFAIAAVVDHFSDAVVWPAAATVTPHQVRQARWRHAGSTRTSRHREPVAMSRRASAAAQRSACRQCPAR